MFFKNWAMVEIVGLQSKIRDGSVRKKRNVRCARISSDRLNIIIIRTTWHLPSSVPTTVLKKNDWIEFEFAQLNLKCKLANLYFLADVFVVCKIYLFFFSYVEGVMVGMNCRTPFWCRISSYKELKKPLNRMLFLEAYLMAKKSA